MEASLRGELWGSVRYNSDEQELVLTTHKASYGVAGLVSFYQLLVLEANNGLGHGMVWCGVVRCSARLVLAQASWFVKKDGIPSSNVSKAVQVVFAMQAYCVQGDALLSLGCMRVHWRWQPPSY